VTLLLRNPRHTRAASQVFIEATTSYHDLPVLSKGAVTTCSHESPDFEGNPSMPLQSSDPSQVLASECQPVGAGIFEMEDGVRAPLLVRVWDKTKVWQNSPVPGARNHLYFHLEPAVDLGPSHVIVISGLTGTVTPTAPSVSNDCTSNVHDVASCTPVVSRVKLSNLWPPVLGKQVTATACGNTWQTTCALSGAHWTMESGTLKLTVENNKVMAKGQAFVFSMQIQNGLTPQAPPTVSIALVPSSRGEGFTSAATTMESAAGYSDTRALYLVQPVRLEVHVGCSVLVELQAREGSRRYTTAILPVNEAHGAEAKALAARAHAEAAAAVASASKVAARAAILAAAAALEAESELASVRESASSTPFPLPAGAILSEETCLDYADIGAASATGSHASTDGIGGCIAPSHTLSWTPSREQWGLEAQACFLASTQSAINKALCFHIVGDKP